MASKQGLSHFRVLVDCDNAIKSYMSLEKVIPLLVERKVLSEKDGERIVKKYDFKYFTALMRAKKMREFLVFLEVIQSLGKQDIETNKLMKIMAESLKDLKATSEIAKSTISSFINAAEEDIETDKDTKPQSLQEENVASSETAVDSKLSSPHSLTSSLNLPPSHPPTSADHHHPSPPPGFTGGCKSMLFTHEGGMMYLSAEHGVTVIIPSGAISADVKVAMSVHAYLHGPFSLPDGVQLCSAIVWFGVQPSIEFQADVTVKIPHATLIEEAESTSELGVYGMSKDSKGSMKPGQVYELTECIEGDFHDGYHAVFKARHFSPYAVGKDKKKQAVSKGKTKSANLHKVESPKGQRSSRSVTGSTLKYMRSNSNHSSSFESQGSFEDSGGASSSPTLSKSHLRNVSQPDSKLPSSNVTVAESSLKLCIAHCMPSDRSMKHWKSSFAVCYSHPTGVTALRRFALNSYGKGVKVISRSMLLTSRELQLTPQDWTSDDNQWRVTANQTPVLSEEDILIQLPDRSMLENPQQFCEETVDFLPQITYAVQAFKYPPTSPLNKRIGVHGAIASNGEEIYFTLESSKIVCKEPTILFKLYLYQQTSEVVTALRCETDFQLDIQNPDHIKFLADLAFQLAKTDVKLLTQIFPFEEYQKDALYSGNFKNIYEAVYRSLTAWVIRNGSNAKLSVFKELVKKFNISTDLKVTETETSGSKQHILLDPQWDLIPISQELPATFLPEVSIKIQHCWKPVGRLMGISENELDVTEIAGLNNLREQSYSMLYEWMRRLGNDATYGILFKAIHCVWEHDPLSVNDAWCYSTHVAEELQQECMYA